MAEGVVGQDERGHGFHHGDGAGQHARVVASAAGDRRVLVVDADVFCSRMMVAVGLNPTRK